MTNEDDARSDTTPSRLAKGAAWLRNARSSCASVVFGAKMDPGSGRTKCRRDPVSPRAFAVLFDDGSAVLYKRVCKLPVPNEEFDGRTVAKVFTGIESEGEEGEAIFRFEESLVRVSVADPDITPRTMRSWFFCCPNLVAVCLEGLDTGSVESMNSLFFGCNALASVECSSWDTSSVTDMGSMFVFCDSLLALDVSRWDTSHVLDMRGMFHRCSSLTSVEVCAWNISHVANISYMFNACSELSDVDVSAWDTSSVENMSYAFADCSSLSVLDVSSWNTSSVKDMHSVFNRCSSLSVLDVSSWNTSHVTDLSSMFFGCCKLERVDVSGWDTSSARGARGMFAYMGSLRSLAIGDGWNINLAETGLTVRYPGVGSIDMPPWTVLYDAAVSPVPLANVPLGVAATYYLNPYYVPKP